MIKGNSTLEDNAKLVNAKPESDAWIAEIEVKDASELDGLMDAEAYKEMAASD